MSQSGQGSPNESERRRRRISIALFLFCLVVYNSNGRLIASGDTIPAHLLPFAILNRHTVYLDSYVPSPGGWFQRSKAGHLVSSYPIVLPVLLTPLYLPAAGYVAVAGPPEWRFRTLSDGMEKLAASIIAAISVLLVLGVLRRLTSEGVAIALTLAYAFGTETWVISSQALWQHGLAQVLLAAALLILAREPTPGSAMFAGALCGLMALNRPPDLLFAMAIGAVYVSKRRRDLPGFLLCAVAAALPFLLYNLANFKNVAGGYGVVARHIEFPAADEPVAVGIAGLLLSPGRGLFIFSPFLLLALASVRGFRRTLADLPMSLLWLAFALQIVVYAQVDWAGGFCYGPRFLTDALPFLVVAAVPAVERLSTWGPRIAFLLCVVFSIGVQAVGAYCFPGGGSVLLSHDRFWTFQGAQFYREATAGPAPPVYFQKVLRWAGVAGRQGGSDVVAAVGSRRFNKAVFISQSCPSTVDAGSSFSASVTFQNDGTTTWIKTSNYKLGSQTPGDPWGSRAMLGPLDSIAPGERKTFKILATAPYAGGTYGFRWQMVQEGIEWFGSPGPLVTIVVKPRPSREFSVEPCRLLDTRRPDGPYGGPALTPSVPRVFRVVGQCGVSNDAKGIVFNVTVPGQDLGYLVVYPPTIPIPKTSTVSYELGKTRANNGIIALDQFGQIAVVSRQLTGATDFVLDVVGYLR